MMKRILQLLTICIFTLPLPALSQDQTNEELFYDALFFYEDEEDYEEAAYLFKQLLEREPENANVMFHIGMSYNHIQATTNGLVYGHSKGIAMVIMEPLKGGQLANPPAEALEIMRASGIERTPVDWALQFLWNRPEVSVVLSGMGNQQMVDENCASAARSGRQG